MSGGDCGLRCYTERKNYCKDLHKWGKNLLYMIGLECVAKKLTNRRSWEKISPFLKSSLPDGQQEKENVDPVDWKPADFCPVCSGRRFTAMDDAEEIAKNGEEPVRQQADSTDDRLTNGGRDVDAGSTSAHPKQLNFDFLFSNGGTAAGGIPDTSTLSTNHLFSNPFNFFGFGSPNYLQQLLQWSAMLNPALYSTPQSFLPFLTNPGSLVDAQLTQNGMSQQGISSSGTSGGSAPTMKSTSSQISSSSLGLASGSGGDQPLDLSQKSRGSSRSGGDGTKFQPATAAGVGDFLAKGLPGYSKAPQQCAITNGSSGSSSNANGSKRNYTQLDLEAAVKDIRSGRLGTRRASVVYGIPRSTLRNKIYKLEAAEETGALAAKRAKRSGVAISTSPLDPAPGLADEDSNLSTDRAATSAQTYSVPKEVGAGKSDKEERETASTTFLDESFKETITNVLAKNQAGQLTEELGAVNLRWTGMGIYPPKSAAEALVQNQWYRSPVVSAAVKAASREAFRQCWSEDCADETSRALLKQYRHHFSPGDKERERTETPSAAASGSGSESPQQRKKDNGDDAWKKSRPKRGQYRKYDKNALDEAVRTVRRGEMSVHRAGSYYGVPHSTLEYKVKERNLLRPKKKDASKKLAEEGDQEAVDKQRKSASPRKSSASRKRRTEDEQGSPLSKEILDCLQGDSPASNHLPTNGSTTPNSPLVPDPTSAVNPQEFLFGHPSLNLGGGVQCEQAFFASDMMRRLQAEALNPSGVSRAELVPTGSRGDPNCATQ